MSHNYIITFVFRQWWKNKHTLTQVVQIIHADI